MGNSKGRQMIHAPPDHHTTVTRLPFHSLHAVTVHQSSEEPDSGAEELATRRLNMDVVDASQSKLVADENLLKSIDGIMTGAVEGSRRLTVVHERSLQLLALLASDADE